MSEVTTINCRICGGRYRKITTGHLRRHGLSVKDYQDRFPAAPMVSETYRRNLSLSKKGHEVSPETRAKVAAFRRAYFAAHPEAGLAISAFHKGRKHTAVAKAKIGAASRTWVRTPEIRAKMSAAKLGHSVSEEARVKMSNARRKYFQEHVPIRGPDHYNWKGGGGYTSTITEEIKRTVRWLWHDRCALCDQKSKGRALAVHHIDYNPMNSRVGNLVPLCILHHMRTNTNRDEWKSFFHAAIGRGR